MAKSATFNRVLIYVLAVFGVAADQATKYGVFAWLSKAPGNHYVPLPDDARDGRREPPRLSALVVQHERSDDGTPASTDC